MFKKIHPIEFLKKHWDWLPFINLKKHWSLFLFLFLFLALVDILFLYRIDKLTTTTIITNIGCAYICTLIYQYLSRWKIAKITYLTILLIYIGIFFLINFYCTEYLGIQFCLRVVAIILCSNINESSEFISSIISEDMIIKFVKIIFYISIPFILEGIIFIAKKLKHRFIKKELTLKPLINKILRIISKSLFYIINVFFIGSFIYLICYIDNDDHIIGKTQLLFEYDTPPNLRETQTIPVLESLSDDKPDNIIIIFGESLSRSHMSLYGYRMKTSPELEKLHRDSTLHVFKNVRSCGCSTIAAFKGFMSTYSKSKKNDKEWYECINIPETFRQSGYRTTWMSNQSKKGYFDNEITRYAELCDQYEFTSNDGRVFYNSDYILDEDVIPLCKKYKKGHKNVYFIHLMGSHSAYQYRYPKEYAKFKIKDYKHLKKHQRLKISRYDNSVLYNDYVISQIIKTYASEDAVIIYFSDHGVDLYESSENYIGYGSRTPESIKFGKQIPFLIYTTQTFNEKHPETVAKIKANLETKFDTDELIYALLDLINSKFKNNNDVAKYTLFKNKPQ